MTKNEDRTYSFIQPKGKVNISVVMEMACPGDKTCPLRAFTDASASAWYHDGVHYCLENGLMTGYGNGKFGPNDPITREQLAAILWRYAGSPENAGKLDSFTDGSKTSNYAVSALQWAVEQKIVSGKGSGILDPGGNAARAEVAEMLMRYCETAR